MPEATKDIIKQPIGPNVLSGTAATLEWNGEPLYEVRAFKPVVNLARTTVQMGMSQDTKLTGAGGEFTLQIYHVYTRIAQEVQDALKQGKDVRVVIRSRIADPDAVGGQVESTTFTNCWLNSYPLSDWERDNADSQEFTGGFTPTDVQITEAITAYNSAA